MPVENTIFACDICYTKHSSFETAEACEASHEKQTDLKIEKLEFAPDSLDTRYPDHLHVRTKAGRGAILIYKLIQIRENI